MTFDEATLAQIAAADPSTSVWLSANAGSGKTRVLTDRVAWLLLNGTEPDRILCLTYTKAAAGEMQNRLFGLLGAWAMKDDDDLRAALAQLGVDPGGITDEKLAHARTLFARAIETPGGLKIQTIHAFCAMLLRRFPLEAGVSPQFSEIDDRSAKLLRAEVVEAMADGPDQPLIDAIANRLTDQDAEALTKEIIGNAHHFRKPYDPEVTRRALDIRQGETVDTVLDDLWDTGARGTLIALRDGLAGATDKTMVALRDALRAVDMAAPADVLMAQVDTVLLKKDRTPRAKLLTAAAVKLLGDDLAEEAADLAQQVFEAVQLLYALEAASFTDALHAFAQPFVARVDARKADGGWLDFDDLILKTRDLLSRSNLAQWVLFRLDGGIDHILVDEAQDTSTVQWDVITALAAEFASGEGARTDVARTLFVVGDKKQSIYSFQGAEPDAFDDMQARFGARFGQAKARFSSLELLYSFRSSRVILDLVDHVFQGDRGPGVGNDVSHKAFQTDKPGRVDLWQPVEVTKKDDLERKWYEPTDRVAENQHDVILARKIAEGIKDMLASGVEIEHRGTKRPVQPGDILILVQRRRGIFNQIIRACKQEGLDLAGADLLKIGGEIAVKDLIALLKFAITPEDSLSLAAVLRSPLCGLDEDALFRVAHGRGKRALWPTLRDSGHHTDVVAMLKDIGNQADFLRPYELLERVLIRHDGRRKLLSRLGDEAEEGIDALLQQALFYEQADVPSLTGFVEWLEAEEIAVKRQAETAGSLIRVMTVHGAKGLESPIVILPETRKISASDRDKLVSCEDGDIWWSPPSAQRPPLLTDAHDARRTVQQRERDRLLYVALTRAESWLIVAAAGDLGKTPDDSWYGMIERAMQDMGAETVGEILRLEHGDWTYADAPAQASTTSPIALPDWAETQVGAHPAPMKFLSPSDLEGAKALPGEGLPEAEAKARGSAIHLLLEHLPDVPPDTWQTVAEALLPDAPKDDLTQMLGETARVLQAPELAYLFDGSSLAEVPFVGPKRGDTPIKGIIDRLIVGPDSVLIVDFKTNMVVPAQAQDTPIGILRQMAAYIDAMAAVYPDKRIEAAILWTRTAQLMPIPHDVVTAAA